MVLLLIIIPKTVLETSLSDFYTSLHLHLSIQLTTFDAPSMLRLIIHSLTHQRRFFPFISFFPNVLTFFYQIVTYYNNRHLPPQIHLPPFWNRLPRSLLWNRVNSIVQPLNSISLIQPRWSTWGTRVNAPLTSLFTSTAVELWQFGESTVEGKTDILSKFDILRTVHRDIFVSQQNALFINFIFMYNSTSFGQTYCPSSGVLILCFTADSQHNQYDKYQLLWILLMMESNSVRNM